MVPRPRPSHRARRSALWLLSGAVASMSGLSGTIAKTCNLLSPVRVAMAGRRPSKDPLRPWYPPTAPRGKASRGVRDGGIRADGDGIAQHTGQSTRRGTNRLFRHMAYGETGDDVSGLLG